MTLLPSVVVLLLMLILMLTGCTRNQPGNETCMVVLEDCTDVIPDRHAAEVGRGEDISFVLTLKNGCVVTGTDYAGSELSGEGEQMLLTIHNVQYPVVVSLSTAYSVRIYDPNGGEGDTVRTAWSDTVTNTRTVPFVREGYIQTGWNTEPDGNGEHIGLGSRSDSTLLYAEWAKESPEVVFSYTCTGDTASVTGYCGDEDVCVLPDTLGGKPVRTICAGAFSNVELTEFVCSNTVREIEEGAFENASIERIVLYDSLLQVSDESFRDCTIHTLSLNAARAPVYAGSYYSAFPDKCERLFAMTGRKMVLFSGSSGRYGYDSAALEEAFEEYEVVNMGTYAYTNARPQLDIILQAMQEGDLLVEAPEFDAASWQFCESTALDRSFYSLVETNYRLLELLDLSQYTGVFDALGEYLYEHSRMEERSYSDLASNYDDDGNRIDYPTYNEYGDYVLERPNSERDEMHRMIPADYTSDNITEDRLQALNEVLESFIGKHVDVVFTYAPRNIRSLTQDSTRQRREETEALIRRTLSVPVISEMEESLYSGIYFYEIDNHLSTEGARLRTQQLIDDLRDWMKGES